MSVSLLLEYTVGDAADMLKSNSWSQNNYIVP